MINIPDISQSAPLSGNTRNSAMLLGSIISDIFGISSPIYLPWGYKTPNVADEFPNVEIITEEETEIKSAFGLPIFGSISFQSGEYSMYDKSGKIVKTRMSDFVMPYSCIAEFSREKVLIQTNTLGGTGTVKELYGLADWKISIRGIALNDNSRQTQKTAHEQIDELVKWSNICDSLPILGSLFGRKDIHNIVINSFSVQPVEAKYYVIPFQIEAVSDEPIELIL